MENSNEKVLCKAKIECNGFLKVIAWVYLVIMFFVCIGLNKMSMKIGGTTYAHDYYWFKREGFGSTRCYYLWGLKWGKDYNFARSDNVVLFGKYDSIYYGKLFLCILITVIVLAVFVYLLLAPIRAKQSSLTLTEDQVYGQLKKTFSSKKLQIPIEKLDTVMTSSSPVDKLMGGETLIVRSNSGVVRFRYVRNASEFAETALKQIEIFKKNTLKAPETAGAPAAAVSSVADELAKYKELLDKGVITQEDFDTKKKQLLGL